MLLVRRTPQLLGDDGLFDAERFLQLLNTQVTLHEQLENPNAHGVGERLEEGRLEGLQFAAASAVHLRSSPRQ